MQRLRSSITRLAIVLVLLAGGAAGAQADAEAWLDHPLVDAATGAPFTVRDLEGGVVLVETMATWCGNCRRQLGHLAEAAATLGGEAAPGVPVAYLVISVERGLESAPSSPTASGTTSRSASSSPTTTSCGCSPRASAAGCSTRRPRRT
jgi:thiol-disulfide isomerase/thioredoxin